MISIFSVIFAGLVLTVIVRKKMHYWLLADIKRSVLMYMKQAPNDTIHIMFGFMDHFEPGHQGADLEKQRSRVSAWCEGYPELASKHQDADGKHPQHTFFFPPHYDNEDHLERITELCSKGYGEVEMHLHHDRHGAWPDNDETLRQKINECIESFSRCGVFCLPNGDRKYAFIHGDWALANSLDNGEHCGVNDELTILKQTGCFADFTFPVCNETQPSLPNTIFYGSSNSEKPKGYNQNPVPVEVGKKRSDGLMLIQGIIGLRWKSRTHRLKPSIEQSNIDKSDYPFADRIDYWINKRIHVKGRENWIFVKIHTHGVREVDREEVLGSLANEMYTHLETQYNDGVKYKLHYVSAREMYNIIKAAEDGNDGDPNSYRDYEIPRYVYLD